MQRHRLIGEQGRGQRRQRGVLRSVGGDLPLEGSASGNHEFIHVIFSSACEMLPCAAASRRSASSRPSPPLPIRMATRTLLPEVVQQLGGTFARHARRLRHNAAGAIHQLGVLRLDIHHQVAVNISQADERPCREHVEYQFLRSAGFHARGSGDDLGPRQRRDGNIDRARQFGIGGATDPDRDSAQAAALRRRRPAHTACVRWQRVPPERRVAVKPRGEKIANADRGIVLGGFRGAAQRGFTARHDAPAPSPAAR